MAAVQDLVLFNETNGSYPNGSLVADASGNLYGTTNGGGANEDGTVFEIIRNPTTGAYSANPTTLASFSGTNGANPEGSLIADASGSLYGTTSGGGANDDGTVFEIGQDTTSTTGYSATPTTLASFSGTNGANPEGNLIADASGNLYGTTNGGGANDDGTVFEIVRSSTTGAYSATPTTLVSFTGTNGANPEGSLIADASGNLYGTTNGGGANDGGTVFEIVRNTTTGAYSATPIILASFTGTNGAFPSASLIADASGNLYGTTNGGGTNDDGTVFEITRDPTTGAYNSTPTTLASFNATDGIYPEGSLIADAAGNLYGTTFGGGANGDGTVFEIERDATSPTGYTATPTVIGVFNDTNGADPEASLTADAAGNLYSTTEGGANGVGTVFEVPDSDDSVTCFVTGSRIRVWREVEADVAVEDLVIGDMVVTSSGGRRPICWIGHRILNCLRHSRRSEAMPVRIVAHAFGKNRPVRDLYVSPGHSICVDVFGEVLIPVCALINGRTIQQVEMEQVRYWHVELDCHDVLLAENLPAESYLDTGNRGFFQEAGVVNLAEAPDVAATQYMHADFCRPVHAAGILVDAVRVQLHRQAEMLDSTRVAFPAAA